MAGVEWCLTCDEQWPCATVAMYDRQIAYEAALRRIVEMDTILDAKEHAHDILSRSSPA